MTIARFFTFLAFSTGCLSWSYLLLWNGTFANTLPSKWRRDKFQDYSNELVWSIQKFPSLTILVSCWAWNPPNIYTQFCDACPWKIVLGIPGVRNKLGNLKSIPNPIKYLTIFDKDCSNQFIEKCEAKQITFFWFLSFWRPEQGFL